MHRGSYNIYSPVKTTSSNNDATDGTFWKTLLCSVIVLGVFALILFLIALPLKNELESYDIDIRGSSDFLKGEKESTASPNHETRFPTTPFYDEHVHVPDEYEPHDQDRNEIERVQNDTVTKTTHQKLLAIDVPIYKNETDYDESNTMDNVTDEDETVIITTPKNGLLDNFINYTKTYYPNDIEVTENSVDITDSYENEATDSNSVSITDTHKNEIQMTNNSENVIGKYINESGTTDNPTNVSDEYEYKILNGYTVLNENKKNMTTTDSSNNGSEGETLLTNIMLQTTETPILQDDNSSHFNENNPGTKDSNTENIVSYSEQTITENSADSNLTQNGNDTFGRKENDKIVFLDDDNTNNSSLVTPGEQLHTIINFTTEPPIHTLLTTIIAQIDDNNNETDVDKIIAKSEYESINKIARTTLTADNYYSATVLNGNDIIYHREETEKMLIECKKKIPDENQYCATDECKRISSKVLLLKSLSENPCVNYYKYACEGITQSYIQETDYSKNVYHRIQVKLDEVNDASKDYLKTYKNYFKSCMNYQVIDGIQKVKKTFKELGYNFYEEKTDVNEVPPIEDLLLHLLKRNFAALFDIKVEGESKRENATFSLSLEPVFYEDVVNDLIGDYQTYEKYCIKETMELYEVANDTFYAAYKACYQKMFIADVKRALLSLDVFLNSEMRSHQLQHLLFDFEQLMMKQIANIDVAERKRIRVDKTNDFLSLSYISLQMKHINVTHIFNNLVGDGTINSRTKVQVYHLNYLKELLLPIDTGEAKVDQRRKQHNSILALYAYKLYKDYVLTQSGICDRTEYCIGLSTKLMNDVSSSLYIKSFDKKEMDALNAYAYGTFHEISRNIIHKYLKQNINTPWKAFKNGAVPQDLELLTLKKKMPWTTEEQLENRFVDVNITTFDFIGNTIKLEQRYRRLMYATLSGTPLSPNNLWTIISSPMDTKPTHYWFEGKPYIVLPLAAIPNRKVFSKIPSYISMSDLGYKLAKEIIYYFLTPQDKTNVMNNFNTNVLFHLPADDYNRENQVNLNTKSSARDMLSSVYGAQHAYESYLESRLQNHLHNQTLVWQNSSAEQIFFLHLSQQYCQKETVSDNPISIIESELLPSIFTVNSIVYNNEPFHKLYNCTNPYMVAGINITETNLLYQPHPQTEG